MGLRDLMYSPRVLLKDLLQEVDETEFYDATDEGETLCWNLFKNYWYFAEIGFDIDEVFVQRLKAEFVNNTAMYKTLLLNYVFGYSETYEISTNNTRTPNLTTTDISKDGGTRTDSSTNTVTKDNIVVQERASQTKTSDHTYTGTDTNTTTFGKTNDFTKTETGTDTEEGSRTENRTQYNFAPERVAQALMVTPLYTAYCLSFSKLFMEVFD